MTCPGIVCLGIWFVPESPRWLVGKGRTEGARAIITHYHANSNANHPIHNLEVKEITEPLATQSMTSLRTFFDIRVLFNSRARRYRLMLCMTMAWFGKFSGNSISGCYLSIVL